MMWSGHCLAGHFVLVSNTIVEALESCDIIFVHVGRVPVVVLD